MLSELQRFVGSITVRQIFGVSTLTNRVRLFGSCEFHGPIWCSLMRSITEWLIFGESTCAIPIIFPYFQFNSSSVNDYFLEQRSTTYGWVMHAFSYSVVGYLLSILIDIKFILMISKVSQYAIIYDSSCRLIIMRKYRSINFRFLVEIQR